MRKITKLKSGRAVRQAVSQLVAQRLASGTLRTRLTKVTFSLSTTHSLALSTRTKHSALILDSSAGLRHKTFLELNPPLPLQSTHLPSKKPMRNCNKRWLAAYNARLVAVADHPPIYPPQPSIPEGRDYFNTSAILALPVYCCMLSSNVYLVWCYNMLLYATVW